MTHEANQASTIDYQSITASEKFIALKRRHRRFVLPLTIVALIWYLAFVVAAINFPEVMAKPVIGEYINLGIVLGFAQFLTTFIVTTWYVSFANRKLDPVSAEMREELGALEQKGGNE